MPIDASLMIVRGMHIRLAEMLSRLDDPVYSRTAYHPEHGDISLDYLLNAYAVHGANHVKQIDDLKKKMNW